MLLSSTAIGLSIALFQFTATPATSSKIEFDTRLVRATTARTVTDYFLQAPDRYFFKVDSRVPVTPSFRRQLLKKRANDADTIIDTNNGYISVRATLLDGDATGCRYVMAIFKKSRGSHLVALNLNCAAPHDELVILDPDRNWQDVTAATFPSGFLLPGKSRTIVLPRQGRTMTISDENDRPIASVKFENDRFKVVK